MTATWTLEQKQELTKELKEFQAKTGLHWKYLQKATKAGLHLNHIKDGKYEINTGKPEPSKINDSKFTLIKQYLDGDCVIENKAYKEAVNCFNIARHNSSFLVLNGKTGAGKTFASEKYNKHGKKGIQHTFLITCNGTLTQKEFVGLFVKELGLTQMDTKTDKRIPAKGTTYKLTKMVIDKLIQLDANPLLIIDEAENLSLKNYKTIKTLTDELKGVCGIVLIGAPRSGVSYYNWLKMKHDNEKMFFPQIFSRFGSNEFNMEIMPEDYKTTESFLKARDTDYLNSIKQALKHFDISETKTDKQLLAFYNNKFRGDMRRTIDYIKDLRLKQQINK
ncbi:ATP-binding protein [Flammeovirga sp. SJP92]|uniref:ATP-binding protein n=1 Tax=Flammeovirga sp. SJP92 TaxID=1775430 RepID=UPI0007888B64|nr:ATP-binding protein [Flammeovirga sp. SJP92]KXX70623.1 hypothetical protein AVL50_07315 [Flammeovirga sp. SJP92]